MALLHAAHPISTSKYSAHNPSPMSTPTSTFCSSSSSEDETPTPASSTRRLPLSSPGTPRKIRFAPLPDPRRAVLVTEDGDELPLNTEDSDDEEMNAIPSSASLEPATPQLSIQPASPSTPETPISSPRPPSASLPPTPELPQKPKRWFLRPFSSNRSSSISSAPGTFNVSTEELLTLGTINLFRTSSRESRRSVNSTVSDCSPLSRWTSNSSKRDGEPLSRSQSLTGTRGPASHRSHRAGSGTRLLNGRVYGRKKQSVSNVNPFANARDEEPSFVEWGYGGMGSVKNTSGDSRWSAVQSTGTGLDDGDDGSGAAWVRKRKEARERAAKEKAEAEAAEAAKNAASTPAAVVPVQEEQQPQVEQQAPSTATVESTPKELSPSRSVDHISAVNVPAPLQRHQSTHSHSSRPSVDHAVNVVEPSKPSKHHDGSQSPGSEESSEAEDSEDNEYDEDDEDDEDLDGNRRTALGAGVEKISRHN